MWPFKKKIKDYVPDIESRLKDAAVYLETHDKLSGVSHIVGKVYIDNIQIYLILDVRRPIKK